MSGGLEAWAEVFDDYEIVQPFPQLSRPTYVLTEDERAGTELERFHDVTVAIGRLIGMERRGWHRPQLADRAQAPAVLRTGPGHRLGNPC
ncbi:DUF4132 domain-containing protein [Spirillospora sp. NPDC048911]|uniref:DUF4132 domain-containing protein n=1 Tax=Spirillospora sp. NPDC048911 TaxID=3364527 RepID=UPI003715471D